MTEGDIIWRASDKSGVTTRQQLDRTITVVIPYPM